MEALVNIGDFDDQILIKINCDNKTLVVNV